MNCPLCETTLQTKADDYYFICETCDAYVKDKKFYLTKSEEKDRYEQHMNDVNDVRYQQFTSPITHAVVEKFTPAHVGLDYGCGTGPVISKLLKEKGYQVYLYDPYFFPDEDYLNRQYDFIFSCEVFEHFHHPKEEIEKLVQLLKPNGALLIMTHLYDAGKDFTSWYYRNDPTHIFIYTKKTIEFIADKFNLTIEKLSERFIILRKLSA